MFDRTTHSSDRNSKPEDMSGLTKDITNFFDTSTHESEYDLDRRFLEEVPLSDSSNIKKSEYSTEPYKVKIEGSSSTSGNHERVNFSLITSFLLLLTSSGFGFITEYC